MSPSAAHLVTPSVPLAPLCAQRVPAKRVRSLAPFGHGVMSELGPLLGLKRKLDFGAVRSAFDPMYGPAVRCKRFRQAGISGLASMYPVSDWSCFAPDHHGYQRACGLIIGQTSMGQLGHQCSHAPGRPILHLFSSSRRPRRVTGKGSGITSSLVLSMLPAIRRVE